MNLKRLNRFAVFILLCAMALICASCHSPHRRLGPIGWRAIFDGGRTEGWQMTGPGEMKLQDGELVTYGGMGLFWYTREKFGDCRIRVVFKLTAADDNSGVFIRIP